MMKLKATLLTGILLLGMNASADDDHERARRLREQGQIVPLETVLAEVRSRQEGTLIELELEREDGELVYEIEVLDPDGRVHELLFDARTGQFLGYEDEYKGRGH